MDFKVLIAESAIADLKEIVEFVAQNDADAATRLGNKLIAHALSLQTMPQRFPFHDQQRGIRTPRSTRTGRCGLASGCGCEYAGLSTFADVNKSVVKVDPEIMSGARASRGRVCRFTI